LDWAWILGSICLLKGAFPILREAFFDDELERGQARELTEYQERLFVVDVLDFGLSTFSFGLLPCRNSLAW
jgi:hypothetical protein